MIERRIPIIQLVDGFSIEEHSGGAAQFGIQLARHLDRNRYESFVCGLWRYDTPSERRWRERLYEEGIETTILTESTGRIGTGLIRATALFWQVITRIQPGVINSHFERGDLLGLLSKAAHPIHPAIVRTMHTDQQWQTRPWLGQLLNLTAFPWLFDGEVGISRATQQVMDQRAAARLCGKRATLIYNGISGALLKQLAGAYRARPAWSTRSPRVAIIGRLALQKGHSDFLWAAVDLLRHFPHAECWIVGTGELIDELRIQAQTLGISHAVHFLGQRTDVANILLRVDLLVSSSLWEGFPTVILEAMAARVPVVATDVSGSRELVHDGETGLLVPVGQPDALAQAMVWMLNNHEYARWMSERAWQHIQRYTLERVAADYDRLYQRLLREQRPVFK